MIMARITNGEISRHCVPCYRSTEVLSIRLSSFKIEPKYLDLTSSLEEINRTEGHVE